MSQDLFADVEAITGKNLLADKKLAENKKAAQ